MKLVKIAVATAAMVVSSVSMAGVLTSSDTVEILAFDGQYVKKGTKIQINDTQTHQVVVSVGDIVNGSYFSLDPIVLTFNGSTEDTKITVPQFRNAYDVNKFKSQPTFSIETASGKSLEYKQDKLKGDGFAPNSRVEDNLAKYNAGKGVAAVPAFANAVLEAKGQMVVETKNVKEEQLQLLFSKADKETQKRFLEWAKKNVK